MVVDPEDETTGETPVSVTFDEVTGAGETTLTTSDTGPQPPGGFELGDPPVYYDIKTTASFTGLVTVCIDYDEQFADENNLELVHRETDPDGNEVWVDRTVSLDTENNIICAEVTSFSVFLAVQPVRLPDIIAQLQEIVDNNPGTPLADKIEDALAKAQTALDELNKEPPDNQAAVGNIEGAVGDLEAAVSEGLDSEQGTELMDLLVGIPRTLAADALDGAIAHGQCDSDVIDDAQQGLDEGDELRAEGAFKDAVNKYKDALAKAEGVLSSCP